jgi:hypothetical protein
MLILILQSNKVKEDFNKVFISREKNLQYFMCKQTCPYRLANNGGGEICCCKGLLSIGNAGVEHKKKYATKRSPYLFSSIHLFSSFNASLIDLEVVFMRLSATFVEMHLMAVIRVLLMGSIMS